MALPLAPSSCGRYSQTHERHTGRSNGLLQPPVNPFIDGTPLPVAHGTGRGYWAARRLAARGGSAGGGAAAGSEGRGGGGGADAGPEGSRAQQQRQTRG